MEYITKSAAETKALGKKLAALVTKGDKNRAFALTGELGSGKTTFVQGFSEGLSIAQRIISPTFILLRAYDVKHDLWAIKHFYHIDLYRLEGDLQKEMENLGLTEILKDKENVVLIEWAEKLLGLLPKNTVWINFDSVNENTRKISVKKE